MATSGHEWVPMRVLRLGVLGWSCAACGLRKSPSGGMMRFTYPNGACHDSVTVDEPSCSGAPVDFALRPVAKAPDPKELRAKALMWAEEAVANSVRRRARGDGTVSERHLTTAQYVAALAVAYEAGARGEVLP